MIPVRRHIRPVAALLAALVLAACARETEAAQRARLAGWVALGPTISFVARRDCAVGVYALVAPGIKAALPLTDSPPAMLRALGQRGAAALALPGQGGDGAMLAMANQDRATGMAMRRAALEARACMDAEAEARFRLALERSGTVLAWQAEDRALILMRPAEGWLMLVAGEG